MDHLEEAVEIVHAGPKPGPRALRSRLRRRLWQISIMATRPYARYQDRLNVAVVSAVGDASHQSKEAARATALMESRIRVLEDQLAALRPGEDAMPASGDLEARELDFAGTVVGFFDEGAADRPADGDPTEGPAAAVRNACLSFVSLDGPCLDVSCGAGAFLGAVHRLEPGLACSGADADLRLVEISRAQGLSVEHAEPTDALRSRGESSCSTVAAFDLVDRLLPHELDGLLVEANRALKPGGVLLMDAANPWSQRAMREFWGDRRRVRPVAPEALLGAVRAAGFSSAFVFCPGGRGAFADDRLTAARYVLVARTRAGDDSD